MLIQSAETPSIIPRSLMKRRNVPSHVKDRTLPLLFTRIIFPRSTKRHHPRQKCQLFLTESFLPVRDLAYHCTI